MKRNIIQLLSIIITSLMLGSLHIPFIHAAAAASRLFDASTYTSHQIIIFKPTVTAASPSKRELFLQERKRCLDRIEFQHTQDYPDYRSINHAYNAFNSPSPNPLYNHFFQTQMQTLMSETNRKAALTINKKLHRAAQTRLCAKKIIFARNFKRYLASIEACQFSADIMKRTHMKDYFARPEGAKEFALIKGHFNGINQNMVTLIGSCAHLIKSHNLPHWQPFFNAMCTGWEDSVVELQKIDIAIMHDYSFDELRENVRTHFTAPSSTLPDKDDKITQE